MAPGLRMDGSRWFLVSRRRMCLRVFADEVSASSSLYRVACLAVVAVGLSLVKRLVLKFLEKLHCVGCRDAIFIRRGPACCSVSATVVGSYHARCGLSGWDVVRFLEQGEGEVGRGVEGYRCRLVGAGEDADIGEGG